MLDDAAKKSLGDHLTAIAALVKVPTEDEKEIADALKTSLQPVYQHAFRAGLNKGKEDAKGDVEKVAGEKTTLETQLTDAKAKLAELEKKSPDAAAVRTELEAKINGLKAEVKAEKEAAARALDAERLETARERIKHTLITKHNVDPLAAEYAVSLPAFAAKLRNTAGKWEVLGADNVAEQLAEGTHPLDHYAAGIEKTIDGKFKTSKVEPGSGKNTKPGSTTSTKNGKANRYDALREQAKAERTSGSSPEDLADRLAGKHRGRATANANEE